MTHAYPPPPLAPTVLARATLTLTLVLGPVAAAQSAAPTLPAQAPTMATPVTPTPAATPLDTLLLALRSAPGWRSADLTYRAAQLQLDSARLRAGLNLTAGGSGTLTKAPWDSGDWTGNGTLTLSASLPVLPWSPLLEGVRSTFGLSTGAVTKRVSRSRARLKKAVMHDEH